MSKNWFTVGEVSKITGISKDTLRFYDKIGLLRPAGKNAENGYRQYSIDQFWYIDMITCFRKLGLSIERIRMTLSYQDNDHVVRLLNEQRREAELMRDYYAGVVKDIEWYGEQNRRIADYQGGEDVHLEVLPERRVIYGGSSPEEDGQSYHIRLQENCREEILHTDSIKRSYGYVLRTEYVRQNQFRVCGEYVSIGLGQYSYTKPEHIWVIPRGRYACFITNVRGETADFSPLNRYLERTGQECELVIADEMGLQLFYYNQYDYPCEIKAYLGPEEAPS